MADREATQQALDAQAAAVRAFLALDAAQREPDPRIEAAVHQQPAGPLAREWQVVKDTCSAAFADYLQTSERFPIDDPGARAVGPRIDLRLAASGYNRSAAALESAANALAGFQARYEPALEAIERAADELRRLRSGVDAELAAATDAVTAMEAAGVRSGEVRERLVQAQAARDSLAQAEAAGQPAERLSRLARSVVAGAQAVRTQASEAPVALQRARSALSSVSTRIDASRRAAERVAADMSGLRREFSAGSWADLRPSETAITGFAESARAASSDARAAADAGDAAAASGAVARARGFLGEIDRTAATVSDRLATLRSARENPAQRLERTRFAVRDAQRLVVNLGLVARFAPALDAQVAKLDQLTETLAQVHPDFWHFLTELGGVESVVASVVRDARGSARRR